MTVPRMVMAPLASGGPETGITHRAENVRDSAAAFSLMEHHRFWYSFQEKNGVMR
jgi:hypothetical protein